MQQQFLSNFPNSLHPQLLHFAILSQITPLLTTNHFRHSSFTHSFTRQLLSMASHSEPSGTTIPVHSLHRHAASLSQHLEAVGLNGGLCYDLSYGPFYFSFSSHDFSYFFSHDSFLVTHLCFSRDSL